MKLYILYTGGTIGCVGDPLSPMTGGDFEKVFNANILPMIQSQLEGGVTVTIDYFSTTLDSTNMQPSDWVLMAQKIYDNYQSHDAFMVLHGTDTMAWTSSALSFLLPGVTKPVVVTGSQLPLFYQTGSDPSDYQLLYNTDAVRNVLGGIRFMQFGFPEVGLYFADHLFRGNRVVKSNASEFVAFSSPNYHALGEYGVLPTFYNQFTRPVPEASSLDSNYATVGQQLKTIAANISNNSVIQFILFPAYYQSGDNESLLVSMLENIENSSPALKGIIFEAYGEGNIPDYSSMQQLLSKMNADGKVLIDCTQVFAGDVNYNAYATGAWLKDAGVVGGHDMTPIAALAKLIILIAQNPSASQDQLKQSMSEDVAGELTAYYAISGYQNQFLMPSECLYSANGNYQFVNDSSGALILYNTTDEQNPKEVWKQQMSSTGRLVMQSDNNLVYYDLDHNPLWATNTATIGHNSYFAVGNDGSLSLYNFDTGVSYYSVYRPTQTEQPALQPVS